MISRSEPLMVLAVGSECDPGDGCTLDPKDPNACAPWVRYVSSNTTAATCNSGVVTVTASPQTLKVSRYGIFCDHWKCRTLSCSAEPLHL